MDLWKLYTAEDPNYFLFVASVVEVTSNVRTDIAEQQSRAMKAK